MLAILTVLSLAAVGGGRAAAAGCVASGRASFLITGRVHACGSWLVDRAGHRVRFLSYEVSSMYGGEGDVAPATCGHWQAPPAGLAAKIRGWGMNSVQILISWANIEPTAPTRSPDGRLVHHWNEPYLLALDEAIQQFAAQHVAVVLSVGQSRWSPAFQDLTLPNGTVQPCGLGMPMWLYPHGGGLDAMVRAERRFFAGTDGVQTRFRGIWRMLATRYRNVSAVAGAEMLFEAYDIIAVPFLGHRADPASIDLAGFYGRTGRAIHSVAPGLLTLYADWQSPIRGPVTFAMTRKPRIGNAAYSFELYGGAWTPYVQTRYDRYLARSLGWNVPQWIAEFDAFGYGRRTNPEIAVAPHWKRDTLLLLEEAKRTRTGWTLVGPVDWRLASVMRSGH